MALLDDIVQWDKALMIQLNNLGVAQWDGFWLAVTNQLSWIPLYLLFIFLIFKYYGWKKGLWLVLMAAALVTFSDQLTVFIKSTTGRLRPNQDPSVNELLRVLKNNRSFSFVSGHATTSMAVTLMVHLLLKDFTRITWLFFIWPLMFAYSRIYVGVHFPIDVFCGALLGMMLGLLFYRLSLLLLKNRFPEKKVA